MRTYYWAWPAHLKDGRLLLLMDRRRNKGQVRVKIALSPIKRKARK